MRKALIMAGGGMILAGIVVASYAGYHFATAHCLARFGGSSPDPYKDIEMTSNFLNCENEWNPYLFGGQALALGGLAIAKISALCGKKEANDAPIS